MKTNRAKSSAFGSLPLPLASLHIAAEFKRGLPVTTSRLSDLVAWLPYISQADAHQTVLDDELIRNDDRSMWRMKTSPVMTVEISKRRKEGEWHSVVS
jgi:hypothetical protein